MRRGNKFVSNNVGSGLNYVNYLAGKWIMVRYFSCKIHFQVMHVRVIVYMVYIKTLLIHYILFRM